MAKDLRGELRLGREGTQLVFALERKPAEQADQEDDQLSLASRTTLSRFRLHETFDP